MSVYVSTEFHKNGVTKISDSWAEHFSLLWDGWLPAGTASPRPPSALEIHRDSADHDWRYYTQAQIDANAFGGGAHDHDELQDQITGLTATKASVGHGHTIGEVADLQSSLAGLQAQIDSGAGGSGGTGPQGPQGPAGPAGPEGDSAYEVAVAAGFAGTETAWLASLIGPQGARGPTGAAGSDGFDGPQGPVGPTGPIGPSAYESAIAEGFVGTLEQWLDSLVGPAGPQGPQGESAPDATTTARGIVQLAGDLAGTATAPKVAKIQGVSIPTGAPSAGQVLQASSTSAAVWATLSSGTGVPWLVHPANGSVDIGPLINSALATYGAAWVAPGSWLQNTQIAIADNQSIIGLGQGTTRLRAGTSLTGSSMIVLSSGTSSHFTIQGVELDGDNKAQYGMYFYATGAPTAPDISPDFVPTIRDVSVYDCTLDGIFLGGSYSGGLREARVDNCLLKHNGRWGINVQSSDCWLINNTTHGNGNSYGGYHMETGASGNTKMLGNKAYYENIGIDGQGVRLYVNGGEIQDCTRAIDCGADSYLNTFIDSCGSASQGAVRIGGTGCTVHLHFTGRTPPGGAPGASGGNRAMEMRYGASVLSGFINTNALGRANDYHSNVFFGSNRPAAGSIITYAPSTVVV